jgi:hypothetical protein
MPLQLPQQVQGDGKAIVAPRSVHPTVDHAVYVGTCRQVVLTV